MWRSLFTHAVQNLFFFFHGTQKKLLHIYIFFFPYKDCPVSKIAHNSSLYSSPTHASEGKIIYLCEKRAVI